MKTKVTFLTAILALIMVMPAAAQYYKHTDDGNKLYYGLRLGLGFATVHNSDLDAWDGPSSRTGLNVGAVIGYQLTPSYPVYLESGLLYTEKGGRNDKSRDNGKIDFNLNYLEIPISVKYQVDIDGDFNIQPFFGGYLATGVGGKIKYHKDLTVCSSFSGSRFKRFDGGLRFGCGVEYDMLYAEAAYELGLANIGRDLFEKTHNSCFYLNIGVNF